MSKTSAAGFVLGVGLAAAGAPFGGVSVGVRSAVEVPWVVAVVSGMVRCHPG